LWYQITSTWEAAMTWEETHRRMEALAEAEETLKTVPDQIPWRAEYEDIFGTPEGLAEALSYRWLLRLQVQLDPWLDDDALEEATERFRREMPRVVANLLPEEFSEEFFITTARSNNLVA